MQKLIAPATQLKRMIQTHKRQEFSSLYFLHGKIIEMSRVIILEGILSNISSIPNFAISPSSSYPILMISYCLAFSSFIAWNQNVVYSNQKKKFKKCKN